MHDGEKWFVVWYHWLRGFEVKTVYSLSLSRMCTHRQTDRWIQTDRDRQPDRQTDRQTDGQTDRQTDGYRQTETDNQTDRQMDTDRQRQTTRQKDRQTDG